MPSVRQYSKSVHTHGEVRRLGREAALALVIVGRTMAGLAREDRMPDDRGRIYSERLKGRQGPECAIPHCSTPGRMVCTGWLVFSTVEGRWLLESVCPDHGTALSSGGPSWPIVREVLEDTGECF